MYSKKPSFDRLPFSWAVGIEDTFIPQARPGMRPLEEYELTQHYRFWREDLERVKALGADRVRWGVPWYRVETQPGKFDWQWVDQVLHYMVNELGIEPIVDLVHYGTPLWLEDSFADPQYPQLAARFAREFTARYESLVRYYTPLNEPTVNADFSGRRGQWPPYLTGDPGYVRVLLQIARGIQLSCQAIRKEKPDAVLFAVEAMNYYRAVSQEAETAASLAARQDLLSFDLSTGRVDENHPLYQWLLANGATAQELADLGTNAICFDVFGVNFYPWSSHRVAIDDGGNVVIGSGPDDGHLLLDVLRMVHKHARLPLYITETSAPAYQRESWMNEVDDAIRLARIDGIPVIGLTWFPLFTMIEWDYRLSDKPVEDHLLDLGLVDARFEEGVLVRHSTPLFDKYRALIKRGMPELGGATCWTRLRALWNRFTASS